MPPRKSSRQNSRQEQVEDSDSQVSRSTFQAKDATQWLMFMNGIRGYFLFGHDRILIAVDRSI